MPQGNPEQYLRQALELVREYAAAPEVDDIDTEAAEKVTTLIQSILAQGQKDQLDMVQGKINPRQMAKGMSGGSPAPAPAPMGGGGGY